MKGAKAVAAAAAAVMLGLAADEPRLAFRGDPSEGDFGSVILSGLPRDALRTMISSGVPWEFPVYVGDFPAEGEEKPAVLGRYTVEGALVRFTPRLPFVPGLSYSARLRGDRSMNVPDLELRFTMPLPEKAGPTRVQAVYPSGDEVPSNLIRLYVHFSAPMLPKDVHGHVRLLDEETGSEIPLAFVEVPSGLWDPENRRLTLFIHPGRVKRGVAPGEAMGPVLVEGRSYRLVIGAGMRDSGGDPLAMAYEKVFKAGSPDRSTPDPSLWKLSLPASPAGPLILDMPSPLDHGLMRRLISIRTESGRSVEGLVTISRGETRWELEPRERWTAGGYAVVIHPAIEDLAGNALDRPFELEGEPARPREETSRPIEIPFEVLPGAR